MPSKPDNLILYAQVKKEADERYKVPSAYKSGWLVKTYKERGGTYSTVTVSNGVEVKPLSRWFEEKWVDLTRPRSDGNYEPCGRKVAVGTYPLCRPSVRVTPQTPVTVKELSPAQIEQAKKNKEKVKEHGKIKF